MIEVVSSLISRLVNICLTLNENEIKNSKNHFHNLEFLLNEILEERKLSGDARVSHHEAVKAKDYILDPSKLGNDDLKRIRTVIAQIETNRRAQEGSKDFTDSAKMIKSIFGSSSFKKVKELPEE